LFFLGGLATRNVKEKRKEMKRSNLLAGEMRKGNMAICLSEQRGRAQNYCSTGIFFKQRKIVSPPRAFPG
jgi:hypothetical protein